MRRAAALVIDVASFSVMAAVIMPLLLVIEGVMMTCEFLRGGVTLGD
jgi:hypothetical protein